MSDDAARKKQDNEWPQLDWPEPAHPGWHWPARLDRGLQAGADRNPPGGWVLVLLAFMCIVTVASWGMFLIGWETS